MNRLIVTFFIALCFTSCAVNSKKIIEPSTGLNDFKMNIQGTPDGIKMQSFKGSAWTDLSFSMVIDRPEAIDEYGMTELDKVSNDHDPNYADFLFTITKTKNEIVLQGIKGTAWKELRFNLTSYGYTNQTIDQFGVTSPE